MLVLERPQVQKVNVTWQRGAQRPEGAELRQFGSVAGEHRDWWMGEGERGQVGEQ